MLDFNVLMKCLDECTCGSFAGMGRTEGKCFGECVACGKRTELCDEPWQVMIAWNRMIRDESRGSSVGRTGHS